jgi:hypothetical protein
MKKVKEENPISKTSLEFQINSHFPPTTFKRIQTANPGTRCLNSQNSKVKKSSF